MRHAKVLGLAAVATFALMAVGDAGVASATQICKRVESGGDGKCRNGSLEKELAKGESFTATSTDLVLTSPTTSVACSSSSITARLTSKNAIALLRGKITALSFTGCETGGGTPCVVGVANLPYETVFHKTDILVFDKVGGVVFRLNCGFLASCEFEAREQLIELEGGRLVASREIPYARQGTFCPVAPRLDATYSPLRGVTLLR